MITNFRPGVMTRLGLDYDAVRAINPKARVRHDHRLRQRRTRG